MRDIRSASAPVSNSPYEGLGGSIIRSATSIAGKPGNVRALQTFLSNKGYHLSVDGQRGPQTEAAVAAYHQGITPRAWNSRSAHAGAGARPSVRTPTHGPGTRGTPTRSAPIRRPSGQHPNTNPIAAANAAVADTPLGAQMTAEQQAQNMVASEFDPQVQAMQAQMASVRAAAAQQVANLGKWYGDVRQTAGAVGQQTQQNDAGLMAMQQQANQGMVNLFGGPGAPGASGEAATFADINNAALSQTSAADQAYTQNLQPIIQTQGVEAQSAAQSAANAQIADMAGALSGLQSQRGSAYTKYLSDIQQRDSDNARQDQALKLAQALMPSQVSEAKSQAALAKLKVQQAPIQAARDAKLFGMTIGRYNSERAATAARITAIKTKMAADAKAAGTNGINWDDPNTRSSLYDQLRPIVQTKNGTWKMHPGAAQQNLNLALRTLGLSDNAQARQLANQLLQQTVTNSHAGRMWGQFNYADGKIIKTGKRYKPNKKK